MSFSVASAGQCSTVGKYRQKLSLSHAIAVLSYGGNRVIVRKGHEGERFYLVFSGSVFINDSELDKVSGVAIPVTVNILYRGSVFGV